LAQVPFSPPFNAAAQDLQPALQAWSQQ